MVRPVSGPGVATRFPAPFSRDRDFAERRMNVLAGRAGAVMGLLLVWIVVVGGAGAFLAGWAIGPQAMPLPGAFSPEVAALALLLAIVLADFTHTYLRRRRR
jgi:sterol desaturase/sphingolipid hydroxylase (fatty acid hydroxylase superfamily)